MKIFDVVELQTKERGIIKSINGTKVLVELLNYNKPENRYVEIEKNQIKHLLYKH